MHRRKFFRTFPASLSCLMNGTGSGSGCLSQTFPLCLTTGITWYFLVFCHFCPVKRREVSFKAAFCTLVAFEWEYDFSPVLLRGRLIGNRKKNFGNPKSLMETHKNTFTLFCFLRSWGEPDIKQGPILSGIYRERRFLRIWNFKFVNLFSCAFAKTLFFFDASASFLRCRLGFALFFFAHRQKAHTQFIRIDSLGCSSHFYLPTLLTNLGFSRILQILKIWPN